MSTSKHIDKICIAAVILALVLTFLFIGARRTGAVEAMASAGYESRLFDDSTVHSIDIVMDDWDSFIDDCTDEEYVSCTVVIDGEAYNNVAIRAKGNTSLSSVKSYGNDRYSFKIEFDHYDNNTYYGLDKLCLNNIIQDNTYMKDYLTYRLMDAFGVDAPLCSYACITINGQDWGLYLAVESVEEAFLQRCYGDDYGKLYKPDSMDMGGGRGNGAGFEMPEDFTNADGETQTPESFEHFDKRMQIPENAMPDEDMQIPEDGFDGFAKERQAPEDGFDDFDRERQAPEDGFDGFDGFDREKQAPEDGFDGFDREKQAPEDFRKFDARMGSSDVSLIYTDDNYESYSNIFENAKTDVSDIDKERLIAALKQLNTGESPSDAVNVEKVIRYFVVHNYVLNFDSYTGSMIHNYYLYEKDGQLSMIPWDYNLAFGGFQSDLDATSLVNYPIDDPVSGGTTDSRPMLAWIFSSEEYTEMYHQFFTEFIEDYFDSGYVEEKITYVSNMIAPYVEKDSTKFCTYEEFRRAASTLQEFCLLRAQSIKGQLNGSIPATSEEQQKDSSSLTDASGIAVSDMGDMGNIRNKGGF